MSNRQVGGYFTYKQLASTGCKVAGFQLATSREDFSGSKSKKEFKHSGNSGTLLQARCDRHEVRQLRCWR